MFTIRWIKISVPHTLQTSFHFFFPFGWATQVFVEMKMAWNTYQNHVDGECKNNVPNWIWCDIWVAETVWQSLKHYLFELKWNVQVRTKHSDFLLVHGFSQAKCATRLSNYFISFNFQQFAFLFVGFNQSPCISAHICLIGVEKYANLQSQNWFAQFVSVFKEYTKIFAKVSCMMQSGAHHWIGIHYVCTDDYAIMCSK